MVRSRLRLCSRLEAFSWGLTGLLFQPAHTLPARPAVQAFWLSLSALDWVGNPEASSRLAVPGLWRLITTQPAVLSVAPRFAEAPSVLPLGCLCLTWQFLVHPPPFPSGPGPVPPAGQQTPPRCSLSAFCASPVLPWRPSQGKVSRPGPAPGSAVPPPLLLPTLLLLLPPGSPSSAAAASPTHYPLLSLAPWPAARPGCCRAGDPCCSSSHSDSLSPTLGLLERSGAVSGCSPALAHQGLQSGAPPCWWPAVFTGWQGSVAKLLGSAPPSLGPAAGP